MDLALFVRRGAIDESNFPGLLLNLFRSGKKERKEKVFSFFSRSISGSIWDWAKEARNFRIRRGNFWRKRRGRVSSGAERERARWPPARPVYDSGMTLDEPRRAGRDEIFSRPQNIERSLSLPQLSLYLRFPLSRGYKVEERLVESLNSGSPPSSSQVVGSRCLFLLFPPSLSLSLIEKLFRKFGIRIKSKQIRTFPR